MKGLPDMEQEYYYNVDTTKKILGCDKHYHGVFEIYYLEKGSCTYFIDDRCYEVKEGDVVLIPEGIIHNTVYQNERHRRKLIQCSKKYIPTSVYEKMQSLVYIYRNPTVRSDIDRIFDRIEKEYENSDDFSKDMLVYLTGELLFLLARNIRNRQDITTGSVYIEKALGYVRENFTSDIKLSDVAEICHISTEHLSRKFKKETGLGFNEFLNMLRLQKAEYILKNDKDISVAEVAFACGFNDSNYFSEKFHSVYGYTPSSLRNVKK